MNMTPPDVGLSTFIDLVGALQRIAKSLNFFSALQTPASELRVTVVSGTLPTVSNVSNVNNVVTIGGFRTDLDQQSQANIYVATSVRANIVRV